MTEKAMAPRIRFKGFTDPWEQRKLGDIADIRSGQDYKHLPPGRIPVYGTGGYMTSVSEALSYDKDAVGIGRKGTIDKPYLLYAPFWTVDTLFYSVPNAGIDLNFMLCLFLNINWKSMDESTGLPSLSKDAINKTVLGIPSSKEQRAIGALFRELDSLITLHQRKYDKLSLMKKALLDKMFPKSGESVPEVRFKGFTDPWEQRKLGDEFVILRNNTLSRAELSDAEGSVQNVHYGDILVRYGAIIDLDNVSLPRIASDDTASRLTCDRLRDGDIVVTDTAEDETVGKCSELRGIGEHEVVPGLHTMPMRPLRKHAAGYLGHYLNSHAYHDQLLPLMQGIKVISVSRQAMAGTSMMMPCLSEQRQISVLFSNLDSLITLHQRELELLRSVKKSLLEGMFV